MVNTKNPKESAEEHWLFIEKWLHIVYVDSFIHGYKHGKNNRIQYEPRSE